VLEWAVWRVQWKSQTVSQHAKH